MATNVAASVRQRLLDRTRKTGEDHQVVLTRFALERLLFRLTQLPDGEEFVLKGAFAFLVWENEEHRMTRDLDFLARGAPRPERLRELFEQICRVDVEDDGVQYEAESIQVDPIREEEAYNGLRVTLRAGISSARLPLQIDVGFGDAVVPPPREETFPRLLDDFPAPVVKTYPPEATIAEKLHGIVQFGKANTRMKDYYDLWHLSRRLAFEGEDIADAIQATFERRGRALPEEIPAGLSDSFAGDSAKQRQWAAFVGRSQLMEANPGLPAVVRGVREFLEPLLQELVQRDGAKDLASKRWPPGGSWQGDG